MPRTVAGILVTVLGPSLPGPVAAQDYTDIAAEAGLSVVTGTGGPEKNHIAESTGTGVAVLDYDQDGLPDLYFPNAPTWTDPGGAWRPRSGVLYRNEGDQRFADVTAAARLTTDVYGQGAVSADFDGDGFPDLYVTALGPNLLFRNNGDGTFSEVGDSAGVADSGWSIGAVWLDADGDRTLDLFVANYIETDEQEIRSGERTRRWRGRVSVLDGPRGLVPQANRFFRGRGDGAFEEATQSSGMADVPARYSMGAVALDFDDDGDQDIFVANDSGPNDMLENRGGVFRDAGLLTGVALSADGATQGSMGVAAADADGNGFPDLVVTNFAHDHYAFYQGVAPSLFLEDAVGVGMATATFRPLGWGALFFDAENDGDLDVAFANGHLYPQVEEDPALGEMYGQPDQLFLRSGGSYEMRALARPLRSSRGMALVDVEADGQWEIVVANQDAAPTLWARRESTDAAWIRLRLVDPMGERDALGARVTVVSSPQSRWQRAGESYASDSERVLHFGLGPRENPAAELVEIEVRWPDGFTESQGALGARRTWLLRRSRAVIQLPSS